MRLGKNHSMRLSHLQIKLIKVQCNCSYGMLQYYPGKKCSYMFRYVHSRNISDHVYETYLIIYKSYTTILKHMGNCPKTLDLMFSLFIDVDG